MTTAFADPWFQAKTRGEALLLARAREFAADFVSRETVLDGIVPFAEISQMAEYEHDPWTDNWIKRRSPTHIELLNREIDTARSQYVTASKMMQQFSTQRLDAHRRLEAALAALEAVTP